MMTRIAKMMRNQAGVAMITVLLVGSGLTVVGSAATFVAIKEFRAGGDDRRAVQALAFAEAGIDRVVQIIRQGGTYYQDGFEFVGMPFWNQLNEAGCEHTPITIPEGILGPNGQTYDAELTVYDPTQPLADRIPPSPWSETNDTTAPACQTRLDIPRRSTDPNKNLFAIKVLGSHPAATRVVRQVVEIEPLGLPIGLYAESNDGNGSVTFQSTSYVSPGDIKGREKIAMSGFDPYYTMQDFYGAGFSATEFIPASVHAVGTISCISNCSTGVDRKREHPPSPNCGANGAGGWTGQSLWDGSADGAAFASHSCTLDSRTAATTPPPTSAFTTEDLERTAPEPVLTERDYDRLRQAAKDFGLYCTATTCTRAGSSPLTFAHPENFFATDIAGLPNNFVAFFDYPAAAPKSVSWKDGYGVCDEENPELNKAIIMIVRNGSLVLNRSSGSTEIVGGFFIPEGTFDATGFTTHGTVIARNLWLRGNATIMNSSCWVSNMPGAFLDLTATQWSEIDR